MTQSRRAAPVARGPSVGGGRPLPERVAGAISSSFGVDVSGVRVHPAARKAALLGARAFAHGRDIFLGAGEQATDLALIAHEVAHVVQQHAAPKVQRFTRGAADRFEREAHRASAAVIGGRQFNVTERLAPRVQRFGISDVLDYLADKAYLIPGFRMFTIVLGVNPVNMSRVERNAANVLRAVIEFIPGGALITQALDNYGVFERAGAWVDEQIASLGMTGRMIRDALDEFLDSLHWSDLLHPGDVWDRAKEIFSRPIHRIIDFLAGLVTGIVRFIKDAILRPLAALASETRGWDLLKAVLGHDPITGDEVPRTAETLIGGFMKLIGQEEIWNNLRQARAVERAWAWFQGALAGVLGFVRQIPSLFISALQSLEIVDIVLLPRAFAKVGRVFGRFALDFFGWAGRQVLSLLQIIFEVVAPGAMPYIRKAGGAIQTIFHDPVRFIGLLVRAGIQGFRQFGANFLTHLRNSLIQWLTGTLSGASIYIPQAFEIREIIKFVLSVLGLTWQNVRSKLVRLIPEPVVTALETGFDIVVTLVRDGPAAAWEKIREQIGNLREMVMEQVMTFVRERIVQAAITRLLTSLNPAGAFIQAIIAIYNTVMFFVERLRQIAQVAMSFIDSIAAIASGAIGAAANRVEQTMAGLLTLVISFLARLVGLGNVSDQVISVVNRIRAPIDRALDRIVEWIVATARRLGRLVVNAVSGGRAGGTAVTAPAGTAHDVDKQFTFGVEPHHLIGHVEQGRLRILMASDGLDDISTRIGQIREIVVNRRPPPRDEAQKARLTAIDTDLKGIEARGRQGIADFAVATDPIAQNQIIDRTVVDMRVLLSNLGVKYSLQHWAPHYEAPRHNFGSAAPDTYGRATSAFGNPLSRASDGQGSEATGGYIPGFRSPLERGHLVAKSLGGRGDNASELTPVTKVTNTAMKAVEARVANFLFRGDPDNNLTYTTRVAYRPGDVAACQAWIQANLPNVRPNSAALLFRALQGAPLTQTDAEMTIGYRSIGLTLSAVQWARLRAALDYWFLAQSIDVQITNVNTGPSNTVPVPTSSGAISHNIPAP